MRFADRGEAGRLLAEKLRKVADDAVVYALPRGGVVLGVEVARQLGAPLDLLIARKIGHPDNPEYAVCAVTETGEMICDPWEQAGLDPDWLAQAEKQARVEAARRRELYLAKRKRPSVRKKTAILIDDGVATGLTLKATIAAARMLHPSKVVVAIPVAPRDIVDELKTLADEVVVLDAPQLYLGSVGAYYSDFPQVEDQEVIRLLAEVPA